MNEKEIEYQKISDSENSKDFDKLRRIYSQVEGKLTAYQSDFSHYQARSSQIDETDQKSTFVKESTLKDSEGLKNGQILMTLRVAETKPNFVKFFPGFFYKFSLKNFRHDITQGKLTKVEARNLLAELHKKVDNFRGRIRLLLLFMAIYFFLLALYIYEIVVLNITEQDLNKIDPEHWVSHQTNAKNKQETSRHLEWWDYVIILVYVIGSIFHIIIYLKCVQSKTFRDKEIIFNFLSIQNINEFHAKGIHWSVHPKLSYLRADFFNNHEKTSVQIMRKSMTLPLFGLTFNQDFQSYDHFLKSQMQIQKRANELEQQRRTENETKYEDSSVLEISLIDTSEENIKKMDLQRRLTILGDLENLAMETESDFERDSDFLEY